MEPPLPPLPAAPPIPLELTLPVPPIPPIPLELTLLAPPIPLELAPPIPPIPPMLAPPIPPIPPLPALPLLLELELPASDPEEDDDELVAPAPEVAGRGHNFSPSSVQPKAARDKPPKTREGKTKLRMITPRTRALEYACT